MEEAYSSRADLKDVPAWELYADESSFMRDGKQKTGYAVTTTNQAGGKGNTGRHLKCRMDQDPSQTQAAIS